LRKGDFVTEMSEGKAFVYGKGRGVLCAWNDPKLVLHGNGYLIDMGDRILEILKLDTCDNFCTRWISKPALTITTHTSTPDSTPKPAPATPATKDSTPAPTANTAPAKDTVYHILKSLDLWGSVIVPARRPLFKRNAVCGSVGAETFRLWQKGEEKTSHGFVVKAGYWWGNDTTQTDFWGGEASAGYLAMHSFNPNLWWGIEPVGVGGKLAWTDKQPIRLNHSYETSLIVSHMQTLNAFFDFGQMALWFEGDYAPISLTHRESWRNGFHTFQVGTSNPDSLDAKENNSSLSGEIQFIFCPGWTARPLILGRTCFTFDNRIPKTNDIGAGLAFGRGAFKILGMFENSSTQYSPSVNSVKLSIDGTLGWMAGPWNCKKTTWEE
jgi:hypothetical protein